MGMRIQFISYTDCQGQRVRFLMRQHMALDDLENDEIFSAAVNGLAKVVELITAAPEDKRSLALAAAHQAYLRTAQELGYDESDAQQWASAVMSLIVTNDEVILSRMAADLLGRPSESDVYQTENKRPIS
jgi:hypothetical protein